MATALFGRKLGMTQLFTDDGRATPVTVVQVGPCVVTQVKTEDSANGYNAVQIAFEEIRETKANKPRLGAFNKAGVKPHRHLREFRVDSVEAAQSFEAGQVLDANTFAEAKFVDIQGTTKGRGTAGVIKRWGFKGAKEASHGTHEKFRHGGSIGMSAYPGRVHKNKKMPGHYGVDSRTVIKLKVMRVMPESNTILVKGSVPGSTNALLVVRSSIRG